MVAAKWRKVNSIWSKNDSWTLKERIMIQTKIEWCSFILVSISFCYLIRLYPITFNAKLIQLEICCDAKAWFACIYEQKKKKQTNSTAQRMIWLCNFENVCVHSNRKSLYVSEMWNGKELNKRTKKKNNNIYKNIPNKRWS